MSLASVIAALPDGAGLGLRPELWHDIEAHLDEIDVIELVIDDYLEHKPRQARRELAPFLEAGTTLIGHGVGLSIGSAEGIDAAYVDRVARLLDALQIEVYSEHLSFRRAGGLELGQFVPVPFTEAWAATVVRNVEAVQRATRRTLVLENITWLLGHREAGVGETAFLREVVEGADCGLLLDVTNVLINAANLGYDARQFIAELPTDRVVYAHVAGGHEDGDFHIDSHGHPLPVEALELLSWAREQCPNLGSAIVERDKAYPRFDELLDEVRAARQALHAPAPRCEIALPRMSSLESGPPADADAIDQAELLATIAHTLSTPGGFQEIDARSPNLAERYLLTFPPERLRAFSKVLRFKRREKFETLVPGLFAVLGDDIGPVLRDYFLHDPTQSHTRVADALGFCAFVESTSDDLAVVSMARHEAAVLALRIQPYRPWARSQVVSLHCPPEELERAERRQDIELLDAPVRVRYRRRRRGVWVEPA